MNDIDTILKEAESYAECMDYEIYEKFKKEISKACGFNRFEYESAIIRLCNILKV